MTPQMAFLIGLGLTGCLIAIVAVLGTPDAERLEVEPDTGSEDPYLYSKLLMAATRPPETDLSRISWDQTNEPPDTVSRGVHE